MNSLALVERRISRLETAKKRIDEELEELRIALRVMARLDPAASSESSDDGEKSNGHQELPDDEIASATEVEDDPGRLPALEGLKAFDAATRVLKQIDPRRRGVFHRKIHEAAKARGFTGSEDTIRRAMTKHPELFEQIGAGNYRLRH
jgi:hypothetical protein